MSISGLFQPNIRDERFKTDKDGGVDEKSMRYIMAFNK